MSTPGIQCLHQVSNGHAQPMLSDSQMYTQSDRSVPNVAEYCIAFTTKPRRSGTVLSIESNRFAADLHSAVTSHQLDSDAGNNLIPKHWGVGSHWHSHWIDKTLTDLCELFFFWWTLLEIRSPKTDSSQPAELPLSISELNQLKLLDWLRLGGFYPLMHSWCFRIWRVIYNINVE
jgi:hypothetical protein